MPYLVVIINISCSCSIKVKKCMITWNFSNASVLTSNLKHIHVQMKHFIYTKLSKELSWKFCNLFCGWCIFKALIKFLGISCKLAWARSPQNSRHWIDFCVSQMETVLIVHGIHMNVWYMVSMSSPLMFACVKEMCYGAESSYQGKGE